MPALVSSSKAASFSFSLSHHAIVFSHFSNLSNPAIIIVLSHMENAPQFTFLFSYLTSPIVELVIGQDESETVLTAHQNLLRESPFLSESIANFNDVSPVRLLLLAVA